MVHPDCLGCGACEFACPAGAITQSEDLRVADLVDPLLCNDCLECVPICPVDALVEDPLYAICFGRGCPLTSRRLAGWECTQAPELCPSCQTMLWRPPGETDWTCPRCGRAMRVSCSKVRKAEGAF